MRPFLLDSIISPDWLKYGFIGLVAIVNLLFYFLIKPLIKNEPNKKFWTLTFVIASIVLLTFGGVSSYYSDKIKFDNKRRVDSVEVANMDLQKKLAIYTDRSPEGDSLRAKMEANKVRYDSLVDANKQLERNIVFQQNLISELVMNTIVQSLETDLIATSGKSDIKYQIQDVDFKRLRRAVFLNFLSFNADPNILRQTLITYGKQNGEPSLNDINRIISDLPALMRVRLKWLKQQAIPALEADVKYLGERPMIQRSAYASVKLPKEAIIIEVSDENGGNKETVEDLTALEKERDLLMKRLASL
jgi:hypothetical protein